MAAEIAKARGTDVRVIEALIEDKPSEAAKLAEAAGLESCVGKRLESDKKRNRRREGTAGAEGVEDDI